MIHRCPRCTKNRRDNSPISYVWWHVKGHGLMCWKCYSRLEIPMRVTLNKINAAIKAAGGEEELFRGDGYYYFGEGTAPSWNFETGVYGIARLTDWTVEQWVEEWRFRRDKHLASKS